jgi:hypothetical protein
VTGAPDETEPGEPDAAEPDPGDTDPDEAATAAPAASNGALTAATMAAERSVRRDVRRKAGRLLIAVPPKGPADHGCPPKGPAEDRAAGMRAQPADRMEPRRPAMNPAVVTVRPTTMATARPSGAARTLRTDSPND